MKIFENIYVGNDLNTCSYYFHRIPLGSGRMGEIHNKKNHKTSMFARYFFHYKAFILSSYHFKQQHAQHTEEGLLKHARIPLFYFNATNQLFNTVL